jgi:adenylate cyclase
VKSAVPESRRPLLRYVAGATLAHVMAAIEVFLVMFALGRENPGAIYGMFHGTSAAVLSIVVVVALCAVVVGSALIILPSLRWYSAGTPPTATQREAALRIPRRQTALLATVWGGSALPVLLANLGSAGAVGLMIFPPLFFGTTAAILTSLLLTVRTLRPITAAALETESDSVLRDTAPGVMTRLLSVWLLISALPSVGVAALILARANGWLIDPSMSVDLPVLVLLAVAVVWGLRAMILVSQSISDPVREVVEAMADVEHGQLGHTVEVYERSEIGRLQIGFNRMVLGLRERERLRDLFGRNVGDAVVQLLINQDESIYGDEREVAILFIDLTGSTQLAASRPPQEFARMLNEFFQAVIATVDDHHGFVNKFQGDAALAVFGAPVASATAVESALSTARDLTARMQRLPELDFGIGVATGPVFAGFVGSMDRFEYTVIGDAVNEAARLADRAKRSPGRLLSSGTAVTAASGDERERWEHTGTEVLRGRAVATQLYAPAPAPYTV